LLIATKRTIAAMADVADHPSAVAAELEPQLWSTRQPWFAERLAAMQARIKSRPS
jgi:enoyl-CoA hydratase